MAEARERILNAAARFAPLRFLAVILNDYLGVVQNVV